ncbi:sarcosine oxidase subunit alpha family protein [Lichenihabitans sp. Uapishka_5]|uniref:sarcosine oxidase subunit alpha family protein n=1 Tax=Lichenihabitans sp. Uapishka_5 TaxID=3037302 RepID=UPI0029E7F17E|nr:sarcosine oxidase subunit alpha family protein [Lichenihabitans sp. Uapishka_5]MDX7951068.1 sarcosine oxidase subunit alpha family protein [Lichenihabitans sp. Uapishka_5]
MSGALRLPRGGRIDRSQMVRFSFDGRSYAGCAGDTLASALLSHDVHLFGRSFKYHRPRGLLSAGAEEPNALVTVDRGGGRVTPNLRATQVELYDGLVAHSQNRWPTLALDVGAVNGLVSPMLGAGFYYKTFMGPRFIKGAKLWADLFEPAIRRAAGLGAAPKVPDPDHYANRFAHCAVLVVGAGPAGLAAALAAAATGVRVILCDENPAMGGSLLDDQHGGIEGVPADEWASRAVAELSARPNVTLLCRTQAFGYYNHNLVGLQERLTDHLAKPGHRAPRERMWQVRAEHVVLATGAIERPLVFPDNDRPGIMLASAGRTFLNRFGVKPGRKVVIATAHDSAYRTALDLAAAGIAVARIVDLRERPEGALVQAAERAGLPIQRGSAVVGTRGSHRVADVRVARVSGVHVTDVETITCDLVLMCGGWTPSVHLFSQSRGKLRYDEASQSFLPDVPVQPQSTVGACAGGFGLADALRDGYRVGAAAAAHGTVPPRDFGVVGDDASSGPGFIGATPHDRDAATVKAFVDFQNDVTAKDIALAMREGFRSIEHIKRYTTSGMATDQGKTSNMNALGIAAAALDRPVPAIGLTTFRQPYTPVTFGIFAGLSRDALFDPVRETPIHGWAAAHGARFEDVSLWKRAWYFPQGGEDIHAAVNRECKVVRKRAGLFDASTLGKIEVVGPDAAEFLNRVYINGWSKLGVGKCRYGLMLNEAGFIMDDGVVGRIAADRFHVTTTTGGAPRVMAHLEDYLQTEFPDLKVWLTSTTEQWAVIAVQGPRARDMLQPLVDGMDISADALPHMALKLGTFRGVPMRLFRVSFTGELGFEVNVPADYGRAAWEALWAEGEKVGAVAYGTEAMHVLRAEKGYIIVGQDTDGTVTPDDAGMGGMIGKAKPDFVGQRSLGRPDLVVPNRKQFVGLLTDDPRTVLEEGAQIVGDPSPAKGTHAIGHVTSSYWSEVLGRSIALAVIEGGRGRLGETVFIPMPDGSVAAKLTKPVFYDPEGARLNG